MAEEDQRKSASSWQHLVSEVDNIRDHIAVLKDCISSIACQNVETREEYEKVLNALESLPGIIKEKKAILDHTTEGIREVNLKTSNNARLIEKYNAEIVMLQRNISESLEIRSSGTNPIAQVQDQRNDLIRSNNFLNDHLSKLEKEVLTIYIAFKDCISVNVYVF
jgi:chromosome segregation ATPase